MGKDKKLKLFRTCVPYQQSNTENSEQKLHLTINDPTRKDRLDFQTIDELNRVLQV